jgi:hypothetical protein
MTLFLHLPRNLQDRLANHCRAHGITEHQAVEQAIRQFLGEPAEPTPYQLGAEGFGADRTNSGDIARNSKMILRERFRHPLAR